jgi:UDP-N-acetylmuramoylalanine--D-glutamate ligase
VSRPTGFAELLDQRVGIFGYGIEGHATARRLVGVTSNVVVVDDEANDGALASADGGLEALATCVTVLKSPGIPRRRTDVIELERRGVVVTSALNLWLHEIDLVRVIAVTGTKGNSTTTSLITFFLRCCGQEAHELGNIGRPPYDPDVDVNTGWLVLEVSSFQSLDLTIAPGIVVVTSLGSDHLDWHGSLEHYHEDKLTITRAPGEHITFLADDPVLESVEHLIGGHQKVAIADDTGLAGELGLLGAHNDHNVGLAIAASAQALGRSCDEVRAAVAARATEFVALRGRLTLVTTIGTAHGATVRYVDDGLATAPLPTIAALDVFDVEPLVLIAGGFDRGVD